MWYGQIVPHRFHSCCSSQDLIVLFQLAEPNNNDDNYKNVINCIVNAHEWENLDLLIRNNSFLHVSFDHCNSDMKSAEVLMKC